MRTMMTMTMIQRWHGWEGAGDINKVQRKQAGVKNKGRMESMVSQNSSCRLGADVRGRPNISHSERRRASGPSLCSSSIPFSLHPFPLFQNLAGFSILDAAKEDNIV